MGADTISNVPKRCRLPNDMEIAYQSRAEVAFFYSDIFEKQIYLKHGITLRDGDCIFDVGANIGFFTLFAHQRVRDLKIYAFEPAPPLFEILSQNAAQHGVKARLFNCGISSRSGAATFTFYPNSSGMSSFYPDEKEEKDALQAIMLNQLRQGVAGMDQVMRHAGDLLNERFKSLTYECRLRTISEIILEEGIERIDFLKIDVQKSELDVIEGIAETDWPKIRQLVVEVHDFNGRLDQISAQLRARGFQVAVEQDEHYEKSMLYNVFARRDRPDGPGGGGQHPVRVNQTSLKQIHDRAQKHGAALNRGKQVLEQRKKDK